MHLTSTAHIHSDEIGRCRRTVHCPSHGFQCFAFGPNWGPHGTVSSVLAPHKGGNQFFCRRGMALCCLQKERERESRERNKRQSLKHSTCCVRDCVTVCICVFKHLNTMTLLFLRSIWLCLF